MTPEKPAELEALANERRARLSAALDFPTNTGGGGPRTEVGCADLCWLMALATQQQAELERMREAIIRAVDSAKPYEDESGVVKISLHPFGSLKRIRDEIAREARQSDEGNPADQSERSGE